MSASHSVLPRPPRNPKRRSSGYSNGSKQPLQVRTTTTKPKAPSLSHVINHLNESPKPELKSFLSLDSAITPKASSSRRVSVAASTMSLYSPPIELPPLRLEGLLGSQGKGEGYEQSPSSASSGMLTPTLSAGTSAMTTPSSASTLKNRPEGGVEDGLREPGTSRPSSRASSAASSVILTPTSIVGSELWELESFKWRDSMLGAKDLDLSLDGGLKVVNEEQGEEEFLEEVDQWLVYIRKRIRELEKKHKQSRSPEKGDSAGKVWSVRRDDERYSGVLSSGVYHFH